MQPTLTTCDMRYWRLAPDPRLRHVVACYWAVETDPIAARVREQEPLEDLLIPDALSEIVFNRGTTAFDRWPLGQPHRCAPMHGSYVIGGRSRSVNTRANDPLALAGVKLYSRFLRDLIEVPLDEFRDATLTLEDLADARLLELEQAVGEAGRVDALVGLLDEFFLAALRRVRRTRTAVDALVERIHRDAGTTPIMEWTREARIHPRRLERTFRADLGLTPKQFARVVRFKKHYRALLSPGARARSLSAQLDGFYDQSHFNREFRFFTGVAPTTKLAGRMPQAMYVADHLIEVR